MLTRRARAMRWIAAAACGALLLAGAAWGDDDHFPFGPMRMYSTTSSPSGTVRVVAWEGLTESGKSLRLGSASLGFRPAEIYGQMERLRANPELLRHLAEAYHRLNGGERLIRLRMVLGIHQLAGRRSVSYTERVVASWRRS